jgi:cell division septum initiation protein DivIVA
MAGEQRRGSTSASDRDSGDGRRVSEKSDEYRFADNLPDGGGTVAEREYEDYVLAERDSDSEEPDVLLDVPVVKVDEINLEVEELRARVSLRAEVLDLLKLNVGADVFIGHVGLEIKGVDAQALLKVRLDNVARILDRVLTTVDRNPQLLERLVEGAGTAIAEIGEGAGEAVEDVGEGAGSAVEDVGEGAGSAVEDVGEGTGSTVEDVGESAGSAVEDTGETAKRTAQGAAGKAGKVAGRAGKTVKRTKKPAQKAQEPGASKERTRTREGQRTKRSSRQSSRRERDSEGHS